MKVRQRRVNGFGVRVDFLHILAIEFVLFGAEVDVDIEFSHALVLFSNSNLFIK